MIKKANQRVFMLRSVKKLGFDQDELLCTKALSDQCGDVVWHSGLTTKQAMTEGMITAERFLLV